MPVKIDFKKDDTILLKGIGILMIILHNYFHILKPLPGENEFSFNPDTFKEFYNLISTYPGKSIRYFFSYFGHYGVQLFIFISAYGLFISTYGRKLKYFVFLRKRITKLYPVLIIAVVLKLGLYLYKNQGFLYMEEIKSGLLKLTLLHNFFPNEALTLSGPWWFFSLIIQFYLVFPLLMYIQKKTGSKFLLIMSFLFLIVEYLFNPYLLSIGLNLNYTVFGHLEVFCLGIYFASKKPIYVSGWLVGFAFLIFCLGNINPEIWLLSFVSITIIQIYVYALVKPLILKRKSVFSFFEYIGSISLFLFAVHGMMRHPFAIVAEKYNLTWLTFLLCGLFLSFTLLLAFAVKKLENLIQKSIKLSKIIKMGSQEKNPG